MQWPRCARSASDGILLLTVVVALQHAAQVAQAALVVIGDSYSDIGNGANVLVQQAISTSQVLQAV